MEKFGKHIGLSSGKQESMTHSQPSNGHGVCPIFHLLRWRSQFGEVWLQETRFSWRGPPSHQGVLLNSARSCTTWSVVRQIRSEALGVSRQWKSQGQRRLRGFRSLRAFRHRKYRSGYGAHGLFEPAAYPLTATLLSVAFLDERMTSLGVLGAVLLVVSMAGEPVVRRLESRKYARGGRKPERTTI